MKKHDTKHIDETPEERDKREEDVRRAEEYRVQNEAFIAEVLVAFATHYPPANDISEATRFLTANEIAQIITNIYPSVSVNHFTLSIFLKTAGYRFVPMKDEFNPGFKWMLK